MAAMLVASGCSGDTAAGCTFTEGGAEVTVEQHNDSMSVELDSGSRTEHSSTEAWVSMHGRTSSVLIVASERPEIVGDWLTTEFVERCSATTAAVFVGVGIAAGELRLQGETINVPDPSVFGAATAGHDLFDEAP